MQINYYTEGQVIIDSVETRIMLEYNIIKALYKQF